MYYSKERERTCSLQDFGEAEPYNASTLAWAHGAVVASLNYRVGPFGFLAFSEDAASGARTGNWASTDVDAALVFLRREVAAFGGDASRLTLFGQSSGASLALLHAVLPGSSGLFEGVLSQSGSLGAASLADASETTRTLASYLNCTTTVKACMLERSAADLVYAQGVECFTPNNCAARTSWAPTVDGVALPKDPRHLVAEGLANDVDVALGANTNDSYLFVMSRGPLPRRAYEAALRDLAEGDEQHSAQLLALYPPSANPLADNVASLGWASSDSMLCGLGRLARAFAKFGRKGRVKLYRYNWWFQSTTQCKAVANWHPPEYGSMHQDEVSFVFGQPIFMNLGYTNCSASFHHPSACATHVPPLSLTRNEARRERSPAFSRGELLLRATLFSLFLRGETTLQAAGWPGYDPSCLGCVFDETEAAFSRAVGRLWTNFAAGTNATTDDDQAEWPSIESDRNILLEPTVSLRADGEMRMRSEPALGRADFCRVWDAIAQTH